jgi:hypothetical protein
MDPDNHQALAFASPLQTYPCSNNDGQCSFWAYVRGAMGLSFNNSSSWLGQPVGKVTVLLPWHLPLLLFTLSDNSCYVGWAKALHTWA